MQGACFIIQNLELVQIEEGDEIATLKDTYGAFSGQVVSIVKDLCVRAFLNAQPRIAEGMYLCSL